jgi:hypothetical protein
MTSPFAHPEVQSLFKELLIGLVAESDRGAILVGAAHVDRYLSELFDAVFPKSLNAKQRKSILEYPGSLATFAAKTHVAYATRLIPRSAYEAANALRSIRNDVAHHPDTFELGKNDKRVQRIYEALGTTLPDGLRSISIEMIVDYKIDLLLRTAQELRERDPDYDLGIETREEARTFIANASDVMDAMQKEVPRWELALGVALLCSIVIVERDAILLGLGPDTTMSKLIGAAGSGT